MDFKALMSAQISKSKPSTNISTSTTKTTSKYVKRSDLEAARQAEYLALQAKAESEREERTAKKRKIDEEEAERSAIREEKKRKLAEESRIRREAEEQEQERLRRKRLGLPDLPSEDVNGNDTLDLRDIPDDELQRKLEEMNEPATVPSEDHDERLKRYQTLLRKQLTKTLSKKPELHTNLPIPTTLEPLQEKHLELPSKPPSASDKEAIEYLYRQIASYINLILREWSQALSDRDMSTQTSISGKAASNSYQLVLRDLTPLFRRLEKHDLHNHPSSSDKDPSLSDSLLAPLLEILHLQQRRKYVSANDAYLRLSIGNAAWPIGVTMVGIHERSAREKLHSHDKNGLSKTTSAHIMSDEQTRKILQSIKRCLSFAQVRYPPDDLGQLMG